MKKILLVVLFLFSFSVHAQKKADATANEIELVESTPIGTPLDNPEIRNTQEVWLEMIGRAQKSLDLEEFYVSNEPGKMLEPVLSALYKAADRGVKVRLIVDAGMYKTYPESVDSLGKYHNIEVRKIDFKKIAGGIQHSKYFIIDGEKVFVGSQNFDWRALEHIHELGFRINNKKIGEVFGDVFDLDWSNASSLSGEQFANETVVVPHKQYDFPIHLSVAGGGSAVVSPTYSPIGFIPDSLLWDETAIVRLLDGAKRTLLLQFLTYSTRVWHSGTPYTVIDDAIRRAAKRGVKVRMIVSDWEKGAEKQNGLTALSALPNIEVAFTAIPEWSGGYISYARVEHCKFIVADDTTFWLSSANCEKSYFYSTRNLGIVGTSAALSSKLTKIFNKSWNSPYKELITPEGKYQPREHGEKK